VRFARVAHTQGSSPVRLEERPDGLTWAVEMAGAPFDGAGPTGREWPLREVRLLAPVVPSKILGIGRNYRGAAVDTPTDPLVFFKSPSSVVGPDAAIVLPAASEKVDFEGELAVVIGRRCRNVPRAEAAGVIFGYTLANDVTARDFQRSDGQWTRAKGFDTFCPLGPWVETTPPPPDLRLRTLVDDEVRQDGVISDMIFDIATQIEWLSAVMTLEPGDVILTGTPDGSDALAAGRTVTVEAEGLGRLRNGVRVEECG